MATNENLIPIPGRLHSVATEGHVAGADEIYDDTLQKTQDVINAEIDEVIDDVALIDTTESSPAVVPGFDPQTDTVHVTAQTLSESQKAQVRNNIGLGDVDAKINQAVASEASQRAASDSSLQSSISAETTARANAVSAEASRAQAVEAQLNAYIQALSKSQPVPKTAEEWAAMTSWEEGVIYRVQGTTSYADWMYNGTTTIKMAEFDNAIDDEPTAGSNNLVKSGGVNKAVVFTHHDTLKEIGQSNDISKDLTSSDFANLAWDGEIFFDSTGRNYNGFVIEVFAGQVFTFNTNYVPSNSFTLSEYPTPGSHPTVRKCTEVVVDRKITIQNGERYVFIGNVTPSTFTRYPIITSAIGMKKDIEELKAESQEKILYGKKIVCFGDSLTAMVDNTHQKHYSDYISDLTGALVTNVGIGGTKLRRRAELTLDIQSETDAFAALDIVSFVKAACSENYTYQDAAAEYLDNLNGNTNIQTILNRLKAIDWSTVDGVTIFGGTNDWYADPSSVYYGTTGSMDDQYTLGAINVIVQQLMTTYPHLKIYWFTPIIRYVGDLSQTFDDQYWGDNYYGISNKTLKEFVEGVINEVSLNHIAVCNMYNMGWTKYNMSNYFAGADGTHPKTYNGVNGLAKRMSGFLISEYTL